MGRKVNLLCYWNGEIINGANEVCYNGPPAVPVCIDVEMRYSELLSKMYEITKCDREKNQLSISCRFRPSGEEYISLSIDNDEGMEIMTEIASQSKMGVEIYLHMEQLGPTNLLAPTQGTESIDGVGPFTRMLPQESDVFFNYLVDGVSDARHDNGAASGGLTDMDIHIHGSRTDQQGIGVDMNVIPELVNAENNAFMMSTAIVNNNDIVEQDAENLEELEQEDAPVQYEKAPAAEFTSTTGLSNGIAGEWDPLGSSSQQKDDQEFYIGQRFSSKRQLKNEVKAYSLRTHHQYVVVDSKKSLWVLKCKKKEECNWRLRASILKGSEMFVIKQYNGPHSCVFPISNQDHVQLDSDFISEQVQPLVHAQLSITAAAIQAFVSDHFNYTITYKKAWKAKQKAIERIFGSWEKSYEILPRYMAELKKANPGSVVLWVNGPGRIPGEETFKRVFWAFGPSIEGFRYCRPLISIDGTHLYGKYKGTMLIAVSVDANNQLFPLGFAIVEGENLDSWGWFMRCIKSHVTREREGLCVISDRHAGIIGTMNSETSGWSQPHAYHRYCMRHLASNFCAHFKNDQTLKILICLAAKANQVRKFDKFMKLIERHNPQARKRLDDIPVETWALSHDGGRRYGIMTTNMSEIFNSVLKGARSLPITACVQLTFYRLNEWFAIRGQRLQGDGHRCVPYVEAKLQAYGVKANAHRVILFDRFAGIFSVITGRVRGGITRGNHTHKVDLQNHTCACQKPQLYGFPCSHVVAACKSRSLDYGRLVQDWYHMGMYAETWRLKFNPLRDMDYWDTWEGSTLVPCPSMIRSKRGRPKSTRLHNEMDAREGRTTVKCGICKQNGHNRRSCPNKRQEQDSSNGRNEVSITQP